MKQRILIASTLLMGALPAFAQVSDAEFQALLNESREGQPPAAQEEAADIEVITLSPEEVYREIDVNQIEMNRLQSQIDRLQKELELAEIEARLEALRTGVAHASNGQQPGEFNPSGNIPVVDSTMGAMDQQAQADADASRNVEELKGRLENVHLQMEERMAQMQLSLSQQMSQMQQEREEREEREAALKITAEENEKPVPYDPLTRELNWSLLATTGNGENRTAEIINVHGDPYIVQAGDAVGPLHIRNVDQREVIARLDNGSTLRITPRALIRPPLFTESDNHIVFEGSEDVLISDEL